MKDKKGISEDVMNWILKIIFVFIAVLGIGYLMSKLLG